MQDTWHPNNTDGWSLSPFNIVSLASVIFYIIFSSIDKQLTIWVKTHWSYAKQIIDTKLENAIKMKRSRFSNNNK